jgi:hypothetical protein
MANRHQPFRQHHVTRALKAAHAAGVANPSVTFHTPDGGKIVISGKSDATAVRKPATAVVVRKPVAAVVTRKPAAAAVLKPRGRR